MIITSNDPQGIYHLKHFLHQQFEKKDLSRLRYFLGIEVTCSPEGYLLYQSKNCNYVIQITRLTTHRPFSTPNEHKFKTSDHKRSSAFRFDPLLRRGW